jgi:hypothetical protein
VTEVREVVAEPRGKRRAPNVLVTPMLVGIVLGELLWRYRWRLVTVVAFAFVLAYPPRDFG